MTPEFAVELGRQTMWFLFVASFPAVSAALITGVLIGVFQSVTQIRENTISFVPKMIVIGLVLWMFAPFILRQLLEFSETIFILMSEAGL
jgi:flagellar biosynthetic protein FliQ